MSFGRPGGFTDAFKPSPPARGSFPLDHDGECKHAMIMHLKCLKENQNNNGKCRLEAMRYLQCRMDNDLMTKDNMANLGLGDVLPPDQQSAATTITTALAKEPITGEIPSTSSVPVSAYSTASQQTRI